MGQFSCHGDPQNPPLVLLHGFLGSQQDWSTVIETISQQFYCVSIDLPGHGAQAHQGINSFDDVVAVILQQLQAIGIARFHLLGYSLGGRIALHIAKQVPDRILSLHLESCHPGLTCEQDKRDRKQADGKWAQKLAQLSMVDFLALWYQQPVFAELNPAQRQALIQRRSHNQPDALAEIYNATSLAKQQDLALVPNLLPHRCHFYVGDQDSKFLAIGQQWQQQTQLSLHVIRDAGHNVHLAQPTLFCQSLLTQLLKEFK
ncbi:2-succinyl-6-hydroxy-2,4-cyclohexadiene-1-carboxylate synthase [Shewanella waksmanii]|uniref:2-succinyl-6-hydroxy-2, 4-cyclohexadiene-1-carboxylate synthase n=1 Tax=Shewanella waksmanii TaxID=213783 RepID=UPI003734EF74